MSGQPKISVLLPVYNSEVYLQQAIDSIFSQRFADFELLVVDDGSTDSSASIVKTYQDPRIRYCEFTHQGLACTLNRAIELAKGDYLARMDADDISLPERFSRQVDYLDSHPKCGMVGTWASIMIQDKEPDRTHKHPYKNCLIKFFLLFNNPFVHSSVMMRKDVVKAIGGYTEDPNRQPPEDYELWSRMARTCLLANIPEILHIYREVPGSLSRIVDNPFLGCIVQISSENIAWVTGNAQVDVPTRDLAALLNHAFHLVSARPDIKRIETILWKAANGLKAENDYDEDAIHARTLAVLDSLKHAYFMHRFFGLASIARRLFKRLKRFFSGKG